MDSEIRYESKYFTLNYIIGKVNDKEVEKLDDLIKYMLDNSWHNNMDEYTLVNAIRYGRFKVAEYLMNEFNLTLTEELVKDIVISVIEYKSGTVEAVDFIRKNFNLPISSQGINLNYLYGKEVELAKRKLFIQMTINQRI